MTQLSAMAAPTLISAVTKSSDTVVTITGTGLTGATGVRFGPNPAVSFRIDSGTRITVIAPAGSGTVPVAVSALLDGTSNPLPYTYV